MICDRCGQPIPQGSEICVKCGGKAGHGPEQKQAAPVTSITPAKTVLSIFLSLLFFVTLSAVVALTIARPQNIAAAAAQADMGWILDEAGLSEEIAAGLSLALYADTASDASDADSISDILSREDIQAEISSAGIDAGNISSFLDRENVREEIGKVAEQYITAATEGNYDYHITAEEITGILKTVAPDIREEFDITLTDEDYKAITASLSADELEEYSAAKLLTQTNVAFTIPNLLLSDYPLILFSLLSALLAFSIFLLHRQQVRAAFLCSGIPIFLTGCLFTAAGLLCGPWANLLRHSELYRITKFSAGFSHTAIVNGLICGGAGLVFLAVFAVIKKIKTVTP